MLRGVGSFLRDHGYSIATVREVAHSTVVYNGGDFRGAHFGEEHGTRNHYHQDAGKGTDR